ncbi:Endonuclease/exonuclease/phosphatase [Arabidopsis thaliana x Arabidopsis arenosa]|uniref:Endonuclease/exonuclease/phosphatase n=1 Tax=Arabidopsis thaliana x Arabidopsis arenosa TaxID=1240361 RepID=A0A8T2E9X5_9BRAS|nr:Endonuclease/exonuclease/phosphatase [Arabidopsis thaliana x Arabidopsis arenosa]
MEKRIPNHLKGKGLASGFSPPPCRRIRAPELDTADLIEENSLTLIGRLTNPACQRLWALFPFLSNRWNLKGKALGSDLGKGCFQFKFDFEEDLLSVLKNRPYHFDQWMVIIQKWEPIISDSFPSMIPFWIELQGLPKHYWQPKMLDAIGDDLGDIRDMEITSSSVKIRVLLNGLNPLVKETVVEFPNTQEARVSLDYKNLKNHCTHCQRLTHDKKSCPGLQSVPEPQKAPSPLLGSERNYIPSKEISQRDRPYRGEQRDTSASRSYPQRQRPYADSSFNLSEASRQSHRRTRSTANHSRGESRNFPPRQRLQWREKTPPPPNLPEFSGSSRQRRPPLERVSVTAASSQTPPPIPTNEEVMGDLREVTLQYISVTDPTESAARKRRVIQGEAQNLMAETASQMILAATQANKTAREAIGSLPGNLETTQDSPSLPPGFSGLAAPPAKKRRGQPPLAKNQSKASLSLLGAKSNILFLMETKNPDDKVEKVLTGLSYPSHHNVSPHSPGGGGLALFWKKEVEVTILTTCQNFIDTKIKHAGKSFYSTCLYGEPDRSKRKVIWEQLTERGLSREEPWFLTGDFNDIINSFEKQGGPVRHEGTFVDIRSFMAACDLYDLRHSGNFFSWRGKRNDHLVHCRLDRAMSNSSWAETYPFSHSEYLRFEGSDHRPILTVLDLTKKKKKGIFRYDRRLRANEEVKNIIQAAWSADDQEDVHEKINRCRRDIITWTRETHQNINQSLLEAYKEEEIFSKQRSRQLWLASGDKNSGYFHAITKGRATINKFSIIEGNDGFPQFEEDGILRVITDYFQNLFTSQDGERAELIKEAIQPRISAETNLYLTAQPSDEEIKGACFSIHPDKAPGPDGFSACFFQSNWDTVGPHVISEVQSFFLSDSLPGKINLTHIRLIPKIHSPQKMVDYRPIALCTVFYKIIAKLLSRRLQPVLQDIISENQSAFVPKRAITDNVLITHEVLHYLKTSKAKDICYMAVKTDMSKAYDRIEWEFIRLVMERMGFHPKWIGWIMQCISTVTYSFLLNNSAQGSIVPQRGIRQGDPLSPYLFILCSEVLSGLCSNAQVDGSLTGIRVALGCPRINHLLFADDTMFFCRSDEKSCFSLLNILQRYEKASGQMINKGKSAITFSAKTSDPAKSKVHQILGMQQVGGLGKYLGLPELFGKKKRDMFNLIIDRIRQRALCWSSRFLSTAGKATMLKSVLSAMPTYTMFCFKIPVSLCKRIQSALTRFWWDSSETNRKMCWISWQKLVQPKGEGGLGFRDIPCFNDGLLAKISWRILQKPSCLLAKILLGKYCRSVPFLDCNAPGNASHGWKGILIGRDLLKHHLGKAIGSGSTTLLWSEPWISLSQSITPMGPPTESSQNLTVDHLICPTTKSWIIERMLLPDLEQEILSIRPSKSRLLDKFIWLLSKNGDYSAKSGYQAALMFKENPVPPSFLSGFNWFKEVWNLKCLQKIKFFLWKALAGALPVGELLRSRGIRAESSCPHCQAAETCLHLFFHCPFAKEIWAAAPFKSTINPLRISSFRSGIEGSKAWTTLPPTGLAQPQPPTSGTHFTGSLPPPVSPETMICFSDAAWHSDTKMAGFGWIFLNQASKLEIQGFGTNLNVGSSLLAEALALYSAQQQALDLGFKKLHFASDSQLLISALNSGSSSKELYGILQDILSLALNFEEISFSFVSRKLNSRADAIAKSAILALIVPASVTSTPPVHI